MDPESATWYKTTYIQPHEYIVRHEQPELFADLAARIDRDGYWGEFQGRRYRYLDIGGYKYWHFNIILNRELLSEAPEGDAGLAGEGS